MSFIKVLVESKDHLKHGARGSSCEEETTEQDLFMSGWTALGRHAGPVGQFLLG
jgi:hypothetical protein